MKRPKKVLILCSTSPARP